MTTVADFAGEMLALPSRAARWRDRWADAVIVNANAVHYRFTGLSNLYRLWNDRTFWVSLRLTAIFLAASAIFGVTVTGLLLAVLIQHATVWLRTAVGAVVVVAWMLPPLTTALLSFIGLLFLAPLLWLVLASIDERAGWALSLPKFTTQHFINVTRGDYLVSLLNTLYLSIIANIVSTVVGALGGYALSRRNIPMRDGLMVTILFLTGIPIAIMIVPVFQVFASYGLLSLVPTGIFLGATGLPFSLWLIKTAVDAVPRELEEAALVERANLMQIIVYVTLPVALPGIAAAAIFSFINAWGAFLVPLVLISDPTQAPGQIMIYGLIGAAQVRYGDIAAFSIIYSLPVIALYLVCSRFFTGGFVMGGALKG